MREKQSYKTKYRGKITDEKALEEVLTSIS